MCYHMIQACNATSHRDCKTCVSQIKTASYHTPWYYLIQMNNSSVCVCVKPHLTEHSKPIPHHTIHVSLHNTMPEQITSMNQATSVFLRPILHLTEIVSHTINLYLCHTTIPKSSCPYLRLTTQLTPTLAIPVCILPNLIISPANQYVLYVI